MSEIVPPVKERIEHLASELLLHKKRYYSGQATISDAVYDSLEDELRNLCPEHPVLDFVGTEVEAGPGKIVHEPPMLSLGKTYDLVELFSFVQGRSTACTEKFDGMALSLEYEGSGRLVRASTRGNGRLGENVMEHVMHVARIPKMLRLPPLPAGAILEVRGEVYFPLSAFVPFAEMFDSYRNAVPGTFGRKDVSEAAPILRALAFCAYDFLVRIPGSAASVETLSHLLGMEPDFLRKLRLLESLGFESGLATGAVVEVPALADLQDLEVFVEQQFARTRDYQIDGLVFRLTDERLWESLGSTSHHPRGSMAFKRAGETATTRILGIEENVGRSGRITFRARLDPVLLSGAKISYATLHNAEFIESGGYAPGALVRIIRSGEVIPAIVGLEEAPPQPYILPATCLCGQPAIRRGPDLVCAQGPACVFADRESLVHFAKEIDILGVSDKILARLREAGLVREPADLYRLTVDDLLQLEGFQRKSAENVIAAIANRRELPLSTFLAGLGLSRGGVVKCREVARHFRTLERVRAATVEELSTLRGWAVKSAAEFLASLQAKAKVVDALLEQVKVLSENAPQAVVSGHPLSGKAICITGALARPRDEYKGLLDTVGARYVDSVTSRTDFLVCNETSNSSKYRKALELSIPILSEQQLLDALEGRGLPVTGSSDSA